MNGKQKKKKCLRATSVHISGFTQAGGIPADSSVPHPPPAETPASWLQCLSDSAI